MDIDPKTPICGVRPAALKKLLARLCFDLDDALRALGPDAGARLAQLTADGWIRRIDPGVWEATEKGDSLAATRLMPRFGVEVGRQLVAKVIDVAKAINADDEQIDVVTELVVFGSFSDAQEGELFTEVDFGVVRRSRWSGRAQQLRAMDRAAEKAPKSVRGFGKIAWLDQQLYRRLRSPSPQRIHVEPWGPLRDDGVVGVTVFKAE